ncbi:RpiB/LacA/LacB family sugar-phosphate isomerase [Enterococcus pallens]|uniref:RpiB/LacA/LacB family sugar-phosphate isomerase n=1 Tax=Enterococcus pallens ATCC BAA-351 TaxID=1158607 RepID=R2QGC4_9ENTE|nr:RpiB/LacA/LacB family sugar-phosphate isomerase [Enterococcus pallens]EOH95557.1 RpiB/LacA/LacB family sugar-phosphate isomerase [Enterococcus pallens ATCC BAA-351]EOU21306.1 hypothetical protein I588_02153 [Enterococcus pallens ATCC BAA-351]OJG78805.1 RpiB/LacA/LacB family sugar-phosphate isomerase [Enterococcus pallens]
MNKKIKVILGCDPSCIKEKNDLIESLNASGKYLIDEAIDGAAHYTEALEAVCKAVQSGEYERGILISTTGQEMNIAANKFNGVRSALCHNPYTAKLSRVDTNTNVLCLGTWNSSREELKNLAAIWLEEEYFQNNLSCLNQIKDFGEEQKASC